MSLGQQFILILGMALVTYIPRALPLMLLSSREIPPLAMRWLELIPPAVLAALLVQSLLFHFDEFGNRVLFISTSNVLLMAALPTWVVGWLTRSFFGTVATGMLAVALLRHFFL